MTTKEHLDEGSGSEYAGTERLQRDESGSPHCQANLSCFSRLRARGEPGKSLSGTPPAVTFGGRVIESCERRYE